MELNFAIVSIILNQNIVLLNW